MSQEWVAENRQKSIGYVAIITEVPGVHFLYLVITKVFKVGKCCGVVISSGVLSLHGHL